MRALGSWGGSVVIVLGLGALGCSGDDDDDQGDGDGAALTNPYDGDAAAAAEGATLYADVGCGTCHGADGRGTPGYPDLKDASDKPDGELFEVIELGDGAMVGYGDELTEDEIWKVVTHVRTIGQ